MLHRRSAVKLYRTSAVEYLLADQSGIADMTHFEDLTPYAYCHPEEDPPGTVNVGWLDVQHSFPTGGTSSQFRRKLKKLCDRRFKQTRGFLPCCFCKGMKRPHSSSEMRVASADTVFAAPTLIYHYVVEHQYRPPIEFMAAVLAWDETDDDTIAWQLNFGTETPSSARSANQALHASGRQGGF